MKAKLGHGVEIEFITPAELREIMQEVLSGFARPPQRVRPTFVIGLNASGNSVRPSALLTGNAAAVRNDVYLVPLGYSLRLHRVTFKPDGVTFGAPFVNAAGFIDISRGELVQDGISFSSPGLPLIWSAGTADALDYTNGENVGITITGGPPSTSVSIRMQGTLEPIVRQ